MGVTLKTRKPVDQLTWEDLTTFAVWEYAPDEEGREGQDETWVRPRHWMFVPRGCYSLTVAAEFRLANGQIFQGHLDVTAAREPLKIAEGVLLHEGRRLFISNREASRFEDDREELLAALGLSQSEVFPVRYRLRVPLEGELNPRTGMFP